MPDWNSLDNQFWSPQLGCWVELLERRTLFGQDIAKVLPAGADVAVSVIYGSLTTERPLNFASSLSTIAGARLWNALGSDLFVSPLVSNVLPLPHQFRVLRKALSTFPVRMMLADEVGMGKTVEAGLVIKEMKLRGMAERILILAPKSLMLQWVVEMETLFNEQFDLVIPGSWSAAVETSTSNTWKRYTHVITSVDSVKPRDEQKGWSVEKIAKFNLDRFHDLVGAGFDLVIIDEAHKVAGTSEDVSRYELASELAKAVPHVLLLTATPHSGKSDAFQRLLSLLEPTSFKTDVTLTKESVSKYVIRSEKRSATDSDGKPLFAPRITTLVKVPFAARHALQERLYSDVSEYVIDGYNNSERLGNKGSRLLLTLIQRLVSSSTRAIRTFLERRATILRDGEATERISISDANIDESDLNEIVEGLLFSIPKDRSEIKDVERLLDLAVRVENAGPDARAEALYEYMQTLARSDSEPSKKFLVFDEFSATQVMLKEFLEARGYIVATLNGSMDIAERRAALEAFRGDSQVLLSTDAGGEGLNMQFGHVVFNYSLCWNPMRVEQRIGRVDRIGQTRPVKAYNFVLENSVEARVYEIWQMKLAKILEEFGVDKTGDVLDSAVASSQFENLTRTALLKPEMLEHEFDRVVTQIKQAAKEGYDSSLLFTSPVEESDRTPRVPLQSWLKTIQGGAGRAPEDLHLPAKDTLSLIMADIAALKPDVARGKPIPNLSISELGFPMDGWFAVWKVGIAGGQWRQQQTFALYVDQDGMPYTKSAHRLWDELSSGNAKVFVQGEVEDYDFEQLERFAEAEASELFDSLVDKTRTRAQRRLDALELSYLARRSALLNIVIDDVRVLRRKELEGEYRQRKSEITLAAEAVPELDCLFLARVAAT